MKIGIQHVKAILLLTLITSHVVMTPVIAGDDLVCSVEQYSVISLNFDQTKTVLACTDTFETAKESMNLLKIDYPDLVITHNTSKSPEKIIAATRAIASSFPQRRNDGTANAVTMNIFRNANFSGDTTYMNAYRDMAYYDTLTYNPVSSTGAVYMQISGFTGYVRLDQIDIIPLIYVENNWQITLGGNSFTGSLSVYQIRPRMNEYRVSTNTTYNVREISHEVFSFSTGGTLGVYVYGQAPDWMANGTYFSWDSIHYFYDRSMTQPVKNGEDIGQYFNYYQYLPLRSSSNLSAKHLDDYLIALGFTKKATFFGESGASAMYGEGKAFIDGQLRHGANALLVYALGLHESGRGTSRLAIEKNNIFGWGAVDSSPGDAYLFESVSASVAEHMGRNLRGYLSVDNFRFFGSVMGNKNNGFNTKYASDPYWGNKVAGWAYRIDRYYGFLDYNTYTLAIMEDSGNLSVKKTPSSTAPTMFVIPSRTVQRSVLINDFHQKDTEQWISIMSTQPVTLTDSVIMFNASASEVTVYEWYKSIGYLPAGNLKIIYPGNGTKKIPMVYDASEYERGPVVQVENIGINEGQLQITGYGFWLGVSVPDARNAAYKLTLTLQNGSNVSFNLNSGLPNPNLNTTYGNKIIYHGATFISDIDVSLIVAGSYRMLISAEFNTLSEPVGFEEVVRFNKLLPPISNYLGRSYHFEIDSSNELILVVNDVELTIKKGDVNGDSIIDILDLVVLSRHLSELQTLSGNALLAADVNDDGFVDILDLVRISRILAGLE